MKVGNLVILLLSSILCAVVLGAQAVTTAPQPRATLDQLAGTGFDYVYNLDYDKAADVFRTIIEEYPEDPAGYCDLSANIWLKYLNERRELQVENFTSVAYFARKGDLPVDGETVNQFDHAVNLAVTKAQAILAKDPNNVRALYYLGAAYGNIAAFHATAERSLWTAFRNGTKAYDYHKRVLKLDPQFYDAYLAIGLYDYVAGSIPWTVRWLAALAGYRGNKKRGLDELQLAAEKARYNGNDAKVIATVLLVREKRYDEALTYITALQKEYPRNYLLHVDLAGLQSLAGKHSEAIETCKDILTRVQEGRPHYKRVRSQQIYLRLGNAYLANRQTAQAHEAFNQVLIEADGGSAELTMAHLRMGQVADLLDERTKAVAHYEKVLTLPEFKDSRDLARKYLKKPYRL